MTRSQHSAADLVFLSNEELARRERLNRRNRSNPVTMGDERDHADLHEQLQAMRLQVEQLQALHRQQPQPSLNGGDKPHTYYRNRSAIVPPPIARQDYDIKGQLIQLAEQKQFCGLPNENPMEHIERIEQISTLSKANGVSPEYLKCKLFEFSLAGKALSWLKALAPGSLVGWEAARNAFIDKYYTKAKTISLKAKISGYTQHSGESFSEAWERFCSYRRDCPHHGFTDTQLLTIFYDGLSWDFKGQLNAASNGNFMTRNIADALELIENMAESSSEKCPEYDRSKRVASVEAQQIAELNAKIDMLLKANQRGINSCDREGGPVPSEDNLARGNDDEEECNYVTGHGYKQGFNPNYKHPNLSYRSPNVENPQDQVYPPTNDVGSNNAFMPFQGKPAFQGQGYQKQPYNNYQTPMPSAPPYQAHANNSQDELKTMVQMILANQQKATGEINAKLESQNAKVDSMYTNLNTKFEALSSHVKKLDTQVAQTAEAVKRSQGTLLGKPETNPQVAHIHAISLNTDVVHDLVGSTEDAEHLVAATNSPTTAAPPTPARVYTPRVPYPRPRPKTSEEICIRYEQMFEKLKVEFPSKEVQALPVLMRCIDRRAASHCSIENGVRMVAEEVNAVLKKKLPKARKESVPAPQPKLLPKVEDPGKFVVPCSIAGVEFEGSLCDSGSCVNLMSKAIAERLGITKLEPPKMTLSFANSSTSTPCGTVLNLHVKIGDCMVCADFQVMEMPRGAKTPLILGRPFMASVGALLDMPKKRISFTLIDKNVFYETVQIAGTHQLASSISIVDTATTLGEKRNIMAINPQIPTTKSIPTEKVKRVEQKRASKLFAKISIVIPPHLRDKGDESIKELLQGTMSLFPNVRSWQVKDGVLAAVEKPQRAERAVSIRLPHDSGDPHLLGDPSRA